MFPIILGIAILYWLRSLVFYWGARRAANPARARGYQPRISVVVAARNEEMNIGRCLQSLVAQEYPAERMEIIVMNDGSEDGTEEIISTFVTENPIVKYYQVQKENSHLRGKTSAVAQGFDKATGEIFVTTDADCAVPREWLREIASYFEPGTGLVAGFTVQEGTTIFSAIQSLDWVYLMTLGSAGVGLSKPLGCIGNNLALRREAYESVGGYRGIPFSVTEDLALLQAVCGTGKWGYKYPLNKNMFVTSVPCQDTRTLWAQKRRWAHGGKKLRLPGYLVLIVSLLMNIGILSSIVTLQWQTLAILWAVRWGADLMILMPTLKCFGMTGLLKYFFPYEVYAFLYEILLPFGLLKKEVAWKGRTF